MDSHYIQQYEALEKNHWWWKARKKIILREISRNMGKDVTNLHILDVGCGTGVILSELTKKHTCYGIEPDETLAQMAVDNTDAIILQGSLPNNIPDNLPKFDVILLADVLEHIQDDGESLKVLSSMLKPNGQIFINVPAHTALWSEHDEINQHYRRYNTQGLQRLISDTQLEHIKFRYWGSTLALGVFIFRKLMPKFISKTHYDKKIPHPWINLFISYLTYLEYLFTDKIRLPWGLSIIAILKNKHAIEY